MVDEANLVKINQGGDKLKEIMKQEIERIKKVKEDIINDLRTENTE